jgi:hypothetical protein
VKRWLFPTILILSADYEEQLSAPFLLTLYRPLISITRTVMALTRGSSSNFPCPICIVHRDQLADHTTTWPLRTATQVQKLVQKARGLTSPQDRETLLSTQGLRDIDVSERLIYFLLVFHAPLSNL